MISTGMKNLNQLRCRAASPAATGFCGGGLNWRRETAGSVLLPKTISLTWLASSLSSCSRREPVLPASLLFPPVVFALVFCDTILKVSPSVFPVNSVLLILLGFSWIPAIPAHPKLVWSLTVLASSPRTQSSLTSLIRTIYLCGFSLSLC